MEQWICILLAVVIVIIILRYYQLMGGENYIMYPPHNRVSRTGLKYYDHPFTTNLRRQLNVRLLPPSVAQAAANVGAMSVVKPPPPNMAQVHSYPPGSGAVTAPGSQCAPTSVKLGKADINGVDDEVESYN